MRWWRHRWLWQLAAYLAIVATFGYILDEQQQHNAVQCADRRDGRAALRRTVEEAFRPGSPTDFSAIPSFDDLDPATQTFFVDLGEILSRGENRTEVRDRILETIPPITCP